MFAISVEFETPPAAICGTPEMTPHSPPWEKCKLMRTTLFPTMNICKLRRTNYQDSTKLWSSE
jgi:hypothetical protein